MNRENGVLVYPLNNIQAEKEKFTGGYHPDIKTEKMTFSTKSHKGPQIVEWIECRPAEATEDILEEIDERGYTPAPSQYLLGLGVQYPDLMEQYKYIVSLDIKNLFRQKNGELSFLSINWVRNTGVILSLARKEGQWIVAGWWFAVIKK